MDKLLSAILASDSPDATKRQVYEKIQHAGQQPQQRDVVYQVLYISGNMALDTGPRSQSGHDIFLSWAGYNPQVFRDFVTKDFVIRLLDGRANHSTMALKLLRGSVRILHQNSVNIEPFAELIRSKTIGFIRETNNLDSLYALMELLLEFRQCIPSTEFHPTLCLALIQSISKIPLPQPGEQNVVKFIERVELFAGFTSKLWQNQTSTMNRALAMIMEIISKTDGEEPSVTLAAVIQQFPVEMVPEVVETVLADTTLQDEQLSAAVYRLINWLGWITASNLPRWIVAFLRGLAAAKKYGILINVTLNKIQTVFDCLRYQQLRSPVLPVLKLMLLSFQHSPQAFHQIMPPLPAMIRLLSEEGTEQSRNLVTELNDLVRTLMNHYSGFPDLYDPVLDALKNLEEPSPNKMKMLLSENKWSAMSAQSSLSSAVVQRNKSETGKVGLNNLGNTCYLNSVVQALYMCDEFRGTVFGRPAYSLQSLPGQLQQLFAFLKLSERAAYSPRDFVTSSRPPWFLPGQQNDCSEYLKYLLDQLNEAEKSNRDVTSHVTAGSDVTGHVTAASDVTGHVTADSDVENQPSCSSDTGPIAQNLTLIENLFVGQCQTSITCLECGFQSTRTEDFVDLPLAFPDTNFGRNADESPSLVGGDSSVASANVHHQVPDVTGDTLPLEKLIQHYFQPEILKDDNQYHCTRCDKLRDAERTIHLSRTPKYLLFTLLRFSYDAKTQSRTKLLTDVRYPLSLQLGASQKLKATKRKHDNPDDVLDSHTSSTSTGNCGIGQSYQLNSVVVHSGMSSDCGHYYTYARHLTNGDTTSASPISGSSISGSSTSGSPVSGVSGQCWFQFNDDGVSFASYDSFSNVNRRFRLDTPYVLVYRRTGDHSDPDPVLDPVLVAAVERDNAAYRKELQTKQKYSGLSVIPGGNNDRDDPPGGSCGLGGGFLGMNGGPKFIF